MVAVAENLKSILARIHQAARKSGRPPESVQLVAVSKTKSQDSIREARKAGQLIFGENKVQEAREKIEALGTEDYHWHFIGHLQKNKVKYIVGLFECIHSVDSVELAELIHKHSLIEDRVTPILIQVNVSGETSKFGIPPDQLEDLLRAVAGFKGVKVQGLMTIPPFDPDPETTRPCFSLLRQLRDDMEKRAIPNIKMKELSMGMSHDFEVAIEEGATLVRVGTAIFGPREG
jgi:pyridoxal phosphate enzyme (YggS family)